LELRSVENNQAASFLDEIADLLELKGDSKYRVVAYRNAANNVKDTTEDVERLWAAGDLEAIPGIGKSISSKLGELLQTGHSAYLDELRREVPAGVRHLLAVPGLGAARARIIHGELGIQTVPELEAAAREHRLRVLPGIREKTEEKILREIERLQQRSQRILLGAALPAADEVARMLASNPLVRKVEPAGSIRRMKETIGDIDLIASSERPGDVTAAFTRLPTVKEVLGSGPTKASVLTRHDLQIDLRVVQPEVYGAALQHFTGSKPHNIALREIAISQGYRLNEYGLFEEPSGQRVAFEDEADIYHRLGMDWMPPEIRENRGELRAAAEHRLPDLVKQEDLRGDLQMHTDWSDGTATLEEMTRACVEMGYQYAAVTDHSRSLKIAGGLSVERLTERLSEIEQLNERLAPFRILTSTEVDILRDGSLDYPDEILARLDVVVAAVHTSFKMDRERMTDRILRALRNPHVDILGHPTGRLLLRRDPYEVDLERVIKVASEEGVALEINALPDRLDLDDVWARRAMQLGAMLCINTDAHAPDHLTHMRYGIAVARRGWLEKKDVLNALPLEELLRWLRTRGNSLRKAA
jgi:DNA polymerase (family X)